MNPVPRWLWLAPLLVACNVESLSPGDCGVGHAAAPSSSEPVDSCPAGITVVMSDFLSTQIALGQLDGTTVSESFLSSGSCETDGLAFALSGDVVLPSARPSTGRVVLIDRFGTNVITWADAASGGVLGQLAVGTGFESNPSDYLELDEQSAIVTRWGDNASPGRQAFDRGGDVLLIDPARRAITGAIELPRDDELPPRPAGMTRLGEHVLIALERISLDFTSTGEGELVGLSLERKTVDFVLRFAGLKACGRPAASPNGQLLVVACSGALDTKGNVANVEESALVLLDATHTPPLEIRRLAATSLAGEPLQNDVEFASDGLVLFKTQTAFGGPANNRWLALNLDDDQVQTLLQATPDKDGKSKGIVYGAMSCAPGCSDVCLLADADQGLLQRIRVSDSSTWLLEPLKVEDRVGLPPRGLALR